MNPDALRDPALHTECDYASIHHLHRMHRSIQLITEYLQYASKSVRSVPNDSELDADVVITWGAEVPSCRMCECLS